MLIAGAAETDAGTRDRDGVQDHGRNPHRSLRAHDRRDRSWHYRANAPEIRERRRAFLDELKATVPIYPVTEATAEIVARIGGEQAVRGVNLPLGDLIIGACALELGYAVGTGNVRDFARIPSLNVIQL